MPRFSGFNANTTAVHLRAQTPGDAQDYWLAPSVAFSIDVNDEEADEIRAQLISQSGVTFAELVGPDGVVGNTIVWRPGATGANDPGGNVVKTWAEVYALIELYRPHGRMYLFIDTRFAGNSLIFDPGGPLQENLGGYAEIPAGTWDLEQVWLTSTYNPLTGANNLTFADNAFITNLHNVEGYQLNIVSKSTVTSPWIQNNNDCGLHGANQMMFCLTSTSKPLIKLAGPGNFGGFFMTGNCTYSSLFGRNLPLSATLAPVFDLNGGDCFLEYTEPGVGDGTLMNSQATGFLFYGQAFSAGDTNFDQAGIPPTTFVFYAHFRGQLTDFTQKITTADSPFSGLELGRTILADSTAGPITINMPDAGVSDGQKYTVKDSGGAAGTNPITMVTAGGVTIEDGVIGVDGGSRSWTFDGVSKWLTMSEGKSVQPVGPDGVAYANTIVWRPSATGANAPGGNVCTTWAEVYALIEKFRPHGRMLLLVDTRFNVDTLVYDPGGPNQETLTGVAEVPAGTWDMDDVILGCNVYWPGGEFTHVTFADNAFLTHLAELRGERLRLISKSTVSSPIIIETGGLYMPGGRQDLFCLTATAKPLIQIAGFFGGIWNNGANVFSHMLGYAPNSGPKPSLAPVLDMNGRWTLIEYSTRGVMANTIIDSTAAGILNWWNVGVDGDCDFNQADVPGAVPQFYVNVGGQLHHHINKVAFADSPFDAFWGRTVLVDSSGGAVTINAPSALPLGQTLIVKDQSGNAGANNITIVPAGAETIEDGVISVDGGSRSWVSDGAGNWVNQSEAKSVQPVGPDGVVGNTIVWRPGATGANDPGGNVCTTWADVYALIELYRPHGPITLNIESQFNANVLTYDPGGPNEATFTGIAEVPAGAWDMDQVTLSNTFRGSFAPTYLTFADNAFFDNLRIIKGTDLNIVSKSTVSSPIRIALDVIEISGVRLDMFCLTTTAAPLFKIVSGTFFGGLFTSGSHTEGMLLGRRPWRGGSGPSLAPVFDLNGEFGLFEFADRGCMANTIMDSTASFIDVGFWPTTLNSDHSFDQPGLVNNPIYYINEQKSRPTDWITGSVVTDVEGPSALNPYVALPGETVLVDSSVNPVFVQGPPASFATGQKLTVKDVGGAAAVNAITIVPRGTDTIEDGSLTVNNSCKSWTSDGVGKLWKVFG